MSEAPPARRVVLVVDPAPVTRARVCSLLAEHLEAEVIGCDGARDEVLRRLVVVQPTCVILEVPVDDFALLGDIRGACPGCCVVVLTNHPEAELRAACLRAGADHVLAKATEFERVVDVVSALGAAPEQGGGPSA